MSKMTTYKPFIGYGEDKEMWVNHFEIFHDPNPNARGRIGDFQGVYIFVPLEPYKLVRIGTMK